MLNWGCSQRSSSPRQPIGIRRARGLKTQKQSWSLWPAEFFAEFSVYFFFVTKTPKKIGSSLGQRTQKLPRCFSGHWIKTWPSLVSIGQPHVIYLGNRSLHPITPTFTEQCVRLPLSLRSTSVRDLSAKHREFTRFNHISGHIQSAKILVSSGFPQDHSSKWKFWWVERKSLRIERVRAWCHGGKWGDCACSPLPCRIG